MVTFYGRPTAPFNPKTGEYDGTIVGYDINGKKIVQLGYNSGDRYIDSDGSIYKIKPNYVKNQIQGYPNGGYLYPTKKGYARERMGKKIQPFKLNNYLNINSTGNTKSTMIGRDGPIFSL